MSTTDREYAVDFLLGCGYSAEDAEARADEVQIWHGTLADYAVEMVEESYGNDIPKPLLGYIDYDAMARDMEFNSEVAEIAYRVYVVNALEF